MKILVATMVLALVGCSSSTGSTPDAPSHCDRDARVGTYRFTWVEQSGDCGPVDSQLVSFNPGPAGAGAGCRINSERWSEGDCKLERDVTCQIDGGEARTLLVSRALTSDAAEITGTQTTTITTSRGCSGTYAIDGVRQ